MKENSLKVFNYLKEHNGELMTAADIADATELPKRSVDGIVTSALQRKGFAVRTPAEVEVVGEDGAVSHKTVKYISLTEEGLALEPEAE